MIFVGSRIPKDEQFIDIKKQSEKKKFFSAGDCVSPGIIQAAVLSGHSVARQIIDDHKNDRIYLREQIFN